MTRSSSSSPSCSSSSSCSSSTAAEPSARVRRSSAVLMAWRTHRRNSRDIVSYYTSRDIVSFYIYNDTYLAHPSSAAHECCVFDIAGVVPLHILTTHPAEKFWPSFVELSLHSCLSRGCLGKRSISRKRWRQQRRRCFCCSHTSAWECARS